MDNKYSELNKRFQVCNVQIGGQHGENPTVLIGSIFYMRHKIVEDPENGIFNKELALQLVKNCSILADKLGVKFMLDVVGDTSKALINYMEFLYENSDVPLLLNSTLPETRIEALKHLNKNNMLNRIVYNSINAFSTDDELTTLKELPIEAAVIQAYNLKSKKPDGPLKALYGNNLQKGLLEIALECNIKNLLIDIPTLDIASISTVAQSMELIRNELGIPVGSAPSNASYASEWMRNKENLSRKQFQNMDASINSYLTTKGANFLFFGPIEGYEWVFPATAVVNAVNVYGMRSQGVKPESQNHPFFKIL